MIKAVNNFKTAKTLAKEKAREQAREPTNLLSRVHFYELIVRISVQKYSQLTPEEGIGRLMTEHLKPGLKIKTLACVLNPLRNLQELFFKNTKVKELLFLNQFGLKIIYDELVKSD